MAWYNTPIHPVDPVIEYDKEVGSIRYSRDSFGGAGQNSRAYPPAQPQDSFELLQNCLPLSRGILDRRWGYQQFTYIAYPAELAYEYQNDTNQARYLLWMQTNAPNRVSIYATEEDGTTFNTNILSSLTLTQPGYSTPRMCCSRDYAYIGIPPATSVASSTAWHKWDPFADFVLTNVGVGIDAIPEVAISSTASSGDITLTSGRVYTVVALTDSGHLSTVKSFTDSTGPLTSKQVDLDLSVMTPDIQVTDWVILATADAGDETLLYFLAQVPAGTATYTDDTPEIDLLANPVYQETDEFGNDFGCIHNETPPTSIPGGFPGYILNHNGRLYIGGQQSLYFSKSLAELTTSSGFIAGRWEESWPAENVLPVSAESEVLTGLLSDGVSLYLGTNRHIRRLSGDGPVGTNPYVYPQILFNDTGVINQDCWQKVYVQGTPAGMIWVTPDARVMGSDFSSYKDIGSPVQDVLIGLDPSAAKTPGKCFAQFFSAYDYDMYLLVIPNRDGSSAILMYDLRSQQWHTWTLPTAPTAFIYNLSQDNDIHWLFAGRYGNGSGIVYNFDPTQYRDQDNIGQVVIPTVVRTAWLHFGMPADRKWLNEIDVGTTVSNMTVTVEGASTMQEFVSPAVLKNNAVATLAPTGTYKVYLSNPDVPARYRYYRFTFRASDIRDYAFLGGFSIEAIPINKL